MARPDKGGEESYPKAMAEDADSKLGRSIAYLYLCNWVKQLWIGALLNLSLNLLCTLIFASSWVD